MALVIGTNCGFVTTAPVSDPQGSSHTATVDNTIRVSLFTSPSSAIKITEIGWWCYNATEAANFSVALYAADGVVVPGEAGTLLYSSSSSAKGTSAGWKAISGLNWAISGGTNYWLAVYLEDTATATTTDSQVLGGGNDSRSVAPFPDPFGGGTYFSATLAQYAVVEVNKNFSLSDQITLSESTGVELNSSVANSESINVSESVSISLDDLKLAAQELITISESTKLNEIVHPLNSDSITLSENTQLSIGINASTQEQITITDTPALSLSIQIHVTDNITITESVNNEVPIGIQASDTITATDTFGNNLVSLISKLDSIGLGEFTNLELPINAQFLDSITLTEAIKAQLSDPQISKEEQITLTENVLAALLSNVLTSDSVTLTEQQQVYLNIGLQALESISVSENVLVTLPDPLAVSVIDSISLSESFSADVVTAHLNFAVSDTITVTDTLQDIGFAELIEVARTLVLVDGRLAYRITGKYSGVPYYVFI